MVSRSIAPANPRRDLQQVLLSFGEYDHITLGDAFEGIAILGGVGSGKTSGSGDAICRALLGQGLGGMVMTAKKGEAERFIRLCQRCGRSDDVVVVNDQSDCQFNFLDYQLELQGRSGAAVENIVTLLDAAIKVAARATGEKPGQGQEQFWNNGIRKHTRSTVSLLILATGGVSVAHMLEVIRAVPRSLEQAGSEAWRQDSLIWHLLAIARDRNPEPLARHDIDQIEAYFFTEFPAIAERTRSIFEAGLYGILDLFSRGSLYALFGRDTNVTPSMCFEGKILVIDLPVATYRAIGMIAQTIFKLAFQRTAECRTAEQTLPLFFLADEFQQLITVDDFHFASISRESRVVNIWLTQSIASLYSVLGADESGKAACDAMLGLASLKVFHSNACPLTNQWAADLIGRRRQHMRSSSIQHPDHRVLSMLEQPASVTSGISESFEYAVMPHEFAALKKGGLPHLETETIVFAGGRHWFASDESYLRVTFKQEST